MKDTSYIEPLSDADFSELLIRHMVLSPEVFKKAQQFKVTGSDMVLDDTYGNDIYKELVNIINGVNSSPVSPYSLFNGIKNKFENGFLDPVLKDNTMDLLEYIFDETRPLEDPSFFDSKLVEFLKKRRAHRLISLYKDDVSTLTTELTRMNFELSRDSDNNKPRIINPFAKIIYKTKTSLIGTELSKLDEKIGGLLSGEYALLIGFSGGCKSTLGVNIIGASAESGTPATYISCEEHEEELAQRFYARAFRIKYKSLREGHANYELEAKFSQDLINAKRDFAAKNLCLIGMKGITGITPNFLYEALNQHFEETGFIPKIVMVDQMQFIDPNDEQRKSVQRWEVEKVVAAELDELSHRPIGGKNFVLWVQHQAKGKLKASFSREEIDGFKGIIHKTDLTLGIGREHERSNQVNLFSLKCRHCADFTLKLRAELEYMNITSDVVSDTLSGQMNITENPNNTMTEVNNKPITPYQE